MYRVLVVDDEPVIRRGLSTIIEQYDASLMSIRSAENGLQALEMIREEQPHFLFTDIRMPKKDGLLLCEEVSKSYPHIQIVVISGYSDFQYAQKSLLYGVKDYLLKPITKKQVQGVLQKLITNLAKSSNTSVYLSMVKLDDWVERMETAIWDLQSNQLDELIVMLKAEYLTYKLELQQQCELLDEYYGILIKKLNMRDVFPFVCDLDLVGSKDAEEAFERFENNIKQLIEDLRVKRKGKTKDPIEEAKNYMEQHLAKEVSLEEVADVLGLNASYFSQLFKQMTGETFVQYRIKRRMEKAKKLLESSQYRITDISYEIGYGDHPHFTKTFKKYTGISPSEYRRKLGID